MGRRRVAARVLVASVLAAIGGAQLAGAQTAAAQSTDPALRGHGGAIRSLAVLADGTVVTGGFDAAVIAWDLERAAASAVLRFHDSSVNALLALPDGCFASAGDDARIARWCGGGAAPRAVLEGHKERISALALSADGGTLASGAWDREVRVWPLPAASSATVGASRLVGEHAAPVTGVVFGRDGRTLVSVSYDGVVRLSDLTEQPPRPLRQISLAAAINGLAALPDGRLVLTAADGRVRLLTPQLDLQGEIELADGPPTAIAVSPDGGRIAVAGMRTPVTLIDVERRVAVGTILGPGLPVWALAFSRDGRELLTGGADRALRRWSLEPVLAAVGAVSAPAGQPEPRPLEDGARVFRACVACHATAADDGPRAGPTLHGIMGRRIATAPGYAYSEALKRLDIVWTPDTIARLFEIGPTAYTPGTKMPEQRITDPADRQALVEWLARVTRP